MRIGTRLRPIMINQAGVSSKQQQGYVSRFVTRFRHRGISHNTLVATRSLLFLVNRLVLKLFTRHHAEFTLLVFTSCTKSLDFSYRPRPLESALLSRRSGLLVNAFSTAWMPTIILNLNMLYVYSIIQKICPLKNAKSIFAFWAWHWFFFGFFGLFRLFGRRAGPV